MTSAGPDRPWRGQGTGPTRIAPGSGRDSGERPVYEGRAAQRSGQPNGSGTDVDPDLCSGVLGNKKLADAIACTAGPS